MPRGKEADVRKREIIEEFYRVIVEEGLEKASLVKIAKRLSVSPSLLIHHFKTKDELILQLIDYIVDKYAGSLSDLPDTRDSKQRINAILDLVFSQEWTKTIDDRVYYTCLHLSFQSQQVKERLRFMQRGFVENLKTEIGEYAKQEPDLDIDVEKVTRLIVAAQEGLDVFKYLFPDDVQFQQLGDYVKPLVLRMLNIQQESDDA